MARTPAGHDKWDWVNSTPQVWRDFAEIDDGDRVARGIGDFDLPALEFDVVGTERDEFVHGVDGKVARVLGGGKFVSLGIADHLVADAHTEIEDRHRPPESARD